MVKGKGQKKEQITSLYIVSKKNFGLKVAGILFALIALLHLIRLITKFEVTFAGWNVQLWLSSALLVVAGALSVWFLLLAKE